MRKILIFILLLTAFSGCEKQDTVSSDGYYQGSLVYQGQPFFSAISFNGNSYSEVASGGALIQKFPCITKGTYKIKQNTISFAPTVFLQYLIASAGCLQALNWIASLMEIIQLIQNGQEETMVWKGERI